MLAANILAATLTRRQREVLQRAVEEGFYAVPRRVTLTHLAGRIGCSKSSLSEMLMTIESSVFGHLVAAEARPSEPAGPEQACERAV